MAKEKFKFNINSIKEQIEARVKKEVVNLDTDKKREVILEEGKSTKLYYDVAKANELDKETIDKVYEFDKAFTNAFLDVASGKIKERLDDGFDFYQVATKIAKGDNLVVTYDKPNNKLVATVETKRYEIEEERILANLEKLENNLD